MQSKTKLILMALVLLTLATIVIPEPVSSQIAVKPTSVSMSVVSPTSTNVVSKSFVVVVSRRGFNGTNKPLILNVVQGDVVHITFLYGDGASADDNPHVIFIEGYDLKTSVISKSNPSATLDFIANETGTFAFYCVIDCAGMTNLSHGQLAVQRAQTGSFQTSISLNETSLNVMAHGPAVEGGDVYLMAILAQTSPVHKPIANGRLDFYVNTTLGAMKVATAVTDRNGIATVAYHLATSGKVAVTVTFAGSEALASSSRQFNFLVQPKPEGSLLVSILPIGEVADMLHIGAGQSISSLPFVRGQNWIPDFRLVGVPFSQAVPIITILLLIIGSVWLTYGYVFAQIRSIKREQPEEPRNDGSE